MEKKLKLKKTEIAALNEKEQADLYGGRTATCNTCACSLGCQSAATACVSVCLQCGTK